MTKNSYLFLFHFMVIYRIFKTRTSADQMTTSKTSRPVDNIKDHLSTDSTDIFSKSRSDIMDMTHLEPCLFEQ